MRTTRLTAALAQVRIINVINNISISMFVNSQNILFQYLHGVQYPKIQSQAIYATNEKVSFFVVSISLT